ncbi:MAG: AmmeMemoRadiSam system radical SAM enzyme [Spirochaetaceae bacterium]|nr:AmmeMemoRadiSam system radical SAM enzyme [Spirochaetaceae bacterium]
MNFYKTGNNNNLICTLCRHYCKLKEGSSGICGINKNTGNKIECLAYGHPSAINVDPIEKKPLYHFLPGSKAFSLGTVGCNFHCSFCQNWQISQTANIDTSNYYSPEKIVNLALEKGCKSIAYTYNEPTIFYPYARDIAIEAKRMGLKNIFVSNGYESKEVINDMEGIIDATNIDLKSFSPNFYKKNMGADLQKVLDNLMLFKEKNIFLEITTLVVPTQNDSDAELTAIASFIANNLGKDIPWHISAFHPDYKELELPSTSIESLKKAYDIGKNQGLNYIYIGNVNYETPTECPECKTILIERDYKKTQNYMKGSHCPNCGKSIPGVFNE